MPALRFIGESVQEIEAERTEPLRTVDVGCGALPLAAWLVRRGHRAFALDAAEDELRALARLRDETGRAGPASWVVGRAERLPLPDASVDLITMIGLLDDLPTGSATAALWEAARVLRSGGFLILTLEMTPPGNRPPRGTRADRGTRLPFTPTGVERLLEAARGLFDLPRRALPLEMKELTWDELDASLQEAFADDGPAVHAAASVTLGALIRRTGRPAEAAPEELLSTLLSSRPVLLPQERHATSARSAHREERDHSLARSSGDRETLLERIELLDAERRRFEQIAEARFRVIRRQEQTLEAYRRGHWRERLRRLVGPKIGSLYQYEPIPLRVPPPYWQRPALDSSPRISLVTPSLNQGTFIERTIRSVVEQGYPNVEYIVQDGGSIDETAEVLDRYRDALAHVASERDRGFGDAVNRGFARSSGEIMAYLNSDDVLLPGALHYVASFFRAHPEVDVVYSHRVVIDEHDREVGRWVLPPHDDAIMTWVDYVPQETLFWRRAIWDRAGGRIDDSFKFAIDWDLLLRLRAAGARFERLPRFLGAFRVHPHQKTSSEMDEVGIREMARLRQRCHGRAVSLAEVRRRQAGYLRRHVLYHKLYRLGVLKY